MANTTKSSALADSTADTDANDVIAPPAYKRLTKTDQLLAIYGDVVAWIATNGQ